MTLCCKWCRHVSEQPRRKGARCPACGATLSGAARLDERERPHPSQTPAVRARSRERMQRLWTRMLLSEAMEEEG